MRYKIVHELPGRLRIGVIIPKSFIIDKSDMAQNLQHIPFITDISFNDGTQSLLIKYTYTDKLAVRDEILEAIEKLPLSILQRKRRVTDNLENRRSWRA